MVKFHQNNSSVIQLVWCSVLQVSLQYCIKEGRGGLMRYFWHMNFLLDVLYPVTWSKFFNFCHMVEAARHLKGNVHLPNTHVLSHHVLNFCFLIMCSHLSLSNYNKENNVLSACLIPKVFNLCLWTFFFSNVLAGPFLKSHRTISNIYQPSF